MTRVAVVTGANKGIGFEIVRGLLQEAKDDLKVILCSRDGPRGETSLKKIKDDFSSTWASKSVAVEQLDIGDDDSIEEFAKVMKEKYGRLDLLIHNAGMAFKNSDPTPFGKQAAPTVNVNYFGTMKLNEALWPLLKESADPRVVFVASQAGRSAFSKNSGDMQANWKKNFNSSDEIKQLVTEFIETAESGGEKACSDAGFAKTCYGTSKLAVIAHAKFLAKQAGNENVFVASICPGYCVTDMTSGGDDRTAAKGAETPVYLALADKKDLNSGEFWYDKEVISFL